MSDAILGRSEELESIQLFLERVRRGPTGLLLAGVPGIGKTTLWQAGVEQARAEFPYVLACRAVEPEAGLAFTGLADLLADRLDETLCLLSTPRRRALEIALLIEEPNVGESPDARAAALGLLDALRALAQSGPVVVAVDDLQWLDASSATVLQFAFRRLRDERVGLFATTRDSARGHLPLEFELLERRTVGPFRLGSLHHLLKTRLGLELARPELFRLHETTGGNPFFALELGRELQHTARRLSPGEPWPVPSDLKELLGTRMARLPVVTQQVLLSAAALARPTVQVLVAAHGERAPDALERAIVEGVIGLEDSRVRFTHPLLAAVCYQNAAPWQQRATHELLAGVVTGLEERARHLALATEGTSEEVAVALEDAAERAAGRGATAGAAQLAELAAELTPLDSASRRRTRLLRAADFHCFSGNRERAREIPESLLAETSAGGGRADVLFKLASARMDDLPATIALCEEALGEAGDDAARRAQILAFRSWIRLQGDLRGALADGRAALASADRAGDPTLLAAAIARVAVAELLTAEITPGLLGRGITLESSLDHPLEFHESPRAVHARYLLRVGQLGQARLVLEEAEQRAVLRGDESTRGQILWILIMAEWLAGRWQRALDHVQTALELSTQMGDRQYRATVLCAEALVCAHLGRVERSGTAASRALEVSEAVGDETFTIWSLGVLGHLELATGNAKGAAAILVDLPARLLALGWADPMVPLWSDTLEALVAVGSHDHARSHLQEYGQRSLRLERPWAIEVAERSQALLAAATGDADGALDRFATLLERMPELPYPFERGRTLLALGGVRRRARQKRGAREALGQALEIFEHLGARLWAEKARSELTRISGRRPPSPNLTETEMQVACLVAEGRSNKEVAAALFMSVHTVEAHLSRIYRKVGVKSRTELGRRLPEIADSRPQARKV